MSRGALPTRVGAGQRARLAAWFGGLALGALLLAAGATPAAGQMPVPPADGYVVDTTGQVDRAQRDQLVALARQINASTGAQLFTVIVDRTDPEPIADFAQRVFEAWKPGRRGIDDGLLLVLAPNNETKKTRLQVGFGLEGAIPDAVARRILSEEVRPALDRDGPAAAARAAAEAIQARLRAEGLTPDQRGRPGEVFPLEFRLGALALGNMVLGAAAVLFIARRRRRVVAAVLCFILAALAAALYAWTAGAHPVAFLGAVWFVVLLILLVAFHGHPPPSEPAAGEASSTSSTSPPSASVQAWKPRLSFRWGLWLAVAAIIALYALLQHPVNRFT